MTSAVTILAATDFSALARHAASRAARIARGGEAALSLIRVLPGTALVLAEGRSDVMVSTASRQ